jgi:hypothetical protein
MQKCETYIESGQELGLLRVRQDNLFGFLLILDSATYILSKLNAPCDEHGFENTTFA